ncbi:MAG: DEAD/DEAH box helicase family protein [Syntrophobacterales bacterium]|nr:DEAD/DEAH box helicase family protein [Syntrophobacterales bacterium]
MAIPSIIDNSTENVLLKTILSDLLQSGTYKRFSVATGYWDLPAMREVLPALKDFLSQRMFNEIRLLIGEEPKIRVGQLDSAFPEKYLNADLSELPFSQEYREVVSFMIEALQKGTLKVKLYKGDFLHAKCYIVGAENENAIGIIGSSNFTRAGLMGNTELNAVEDDHRIVNFRPTAQCQNPSHFSWFEKMWNDPASIDWNERFTLEVLGLSKFGDISYSPYEMYIRILYEIYGDDIEIEETLKHEERFESRTDLTLFQEESYRKVKSRLDNPKIGMCLVGDSVGLGKSYIARRVIEEYGYFQRKNVVVVCPASLRDDWKQHLEEITVNAPVFSITEFGNEHSLEGVRNELKRRKEASKAASAIDLLVIDESHNLKTQGSQSFQNLQETITSPDFCSAVPRVLLLTATPVNNGIKDLANQIILSKGGNGQFFSHFGIQDLESFFGNIQRQFSANGRDETFADLYPILHKIMVKRTKHQVKKDFPDATINDGQPIKFPEERLESILYELDGKEIRKTIYKRLANLADENPSLYAAFTEERDQTDEERQEQEGILDFFNFAKATARQSKKAVEFESIFHFIDRAINGLKLIPYSYLSEKKQRTSDEELQARARGSLTGVMKVTMFKSFDSSIHTFRQRIERYSDYLATFETIFFDQSRIVRPEIIQKALTRHDEQPDDDIMDLIEEEVAHFTDRELRKQARDAAYPIKTPYASIRHDDYWIDRVRTFILQDKEIIALILEILAEIRQDSKLETLKQLLRGELKGSKVLIFSYFATTIDYLKQQIGDAFLTELGINREQIAFLKSRNGEYKQEYVRRFSPVAQQQMVINGMVNDKPELKLLFSTDVLSEGQNLQDCGVIINYDLHWNPVKMIQRNGRISRLGSTFDEVFIKNFRPEAQLDKFLRLMKKLQEKIRIIGGSVGIDSSVLGEQISDRQFGLMEDIYSGDTNRQRSATEELERRNDLAFDEVFENDLRDFMRSASDVERERLRSMNFNKWCGIPTVAGKDKLLVFNIGEGEFDYLTHDGAKIGRADNQLTALRRIRSFDRRRQTERIGFTEKQALIRQAEELFASERSVQETMDGGDFGEFLGVRKGGGANPIVQAKTDLLRLLSENAERYSQDNIRRMQRLLTGRNLSVDNRLRAYLRRNDNRVSLDFLDSLAIQSVHLVKQLEPHNAPDPVIWFGYYSAESTMR